MNGALRRRIVQIGAALAGNAHLSGLITGQIYAGPLKRFCVPGLNCYSCPAALFACPIGSLQAVLTSRKPRFPLYVLGFLLAIGVLLGRFVCGWLCLFGLIEELLYKVPVRKLAVPAKADRILRYGKYAVLAVLVILLPVILRDEVGLGIPYFCKWLCPAGMLEGGIPLLILNKAMRPAAHALYAMRLVLLGAVLAGSVFIYRPFCKYLCPLGGIYGMLQKIGFMELRHNESTCVSCGKCAGICKMQVDPVKMPSSAECIRCGECIDECPEGALRFSFGNRKP